MSSSEYNRAFVASSELFSGFRANINIQYIDTLEDIVKIFVNELKFVLTNHNFESFMTTSHITDPSVAHAIENIIDKNSANNVRNRPIPNEYIGKKFSELFNYFYTEKNEICIGTFYDEKKMGISEFLSSDTSVLDKFIENKLKKHGHSLDEKNRLNVNLNPNKDDIINKGQGALIIT